jgi:hypothetical protein
MSGTGGRQVSGSAVRGVLRALERQGLVPGVAPLLEGTPAAAALERPPLSIGWVSGETYDAILSAVLSAVGEARFLQVMDEAVRHSVGPLLVPAFTAHAGGHGGAHGGASGVATPEALLARLDAETGLVLRGVTSQVSPAGPDALELRIRTLDTPALAWFLAQKPILLQLCEVCRVQGHVEAFAVDADGAGARYRVRYTRATGT